MAGDWIKVEHALPDKPEVVQMAAALGIDQDAVTGKLIRLWIWADEQTRDGNAITVTESFIDRYTFSSGFAVALRKVSWLEGRDGHLSIPNFSRHNGQSAKKRSTAADRQSQSRSVRNAEALSQDVTALSQKSVIPRAMRRTVYKRDGDQCRYCGRHKDDLKPVAGDLVGKTAMSIDHVIPESRGGKTLVENLVTACMACNLEKSGRSPEEAGMSLLCHNKSVTKVLPEKRREEKSIKKETPTPFPDALKCPEFEEAWSRWKSHRSEIKKPLKPTQTGAMLKKLAEWGLDRAMAAIDHTITKGWQGLREPEGNSHGGKTKFTSGGQSRFDREKQQLEEMLGDLAGQAE